MKRRKPQHRQRVPDLISSSSRSMAGFLGLEGLGAVAVGVVQPEFGGSAIPWGGVAIGVALGMTTLPALARRSPAHAAIALCAVVVANVLFTAALVGVPDVHVALQWAFGIVWYGGQLLVATAAYCAANSMLSVRRARRMRPMRSSESRVA